MKNIFLRFSSREQGLLSRFEFRDFKIETILIRKIAIAMTTGGQVNQDGIPEVNFKLQSNGLPLN
jgi:hypothetical protein